MNIVKIILILLGLFAAIFIGSWLIGVVYGLLWYLVVAGVIAIAGFAGYKFLKKADAPQLESKETVSIKEMDNADRALEEYKQKYLPK